MNHSENNQYIKNIEKIENNSVKRPVKKIFGVHCITQVNDWYGLLYPNKITVLLLKGKNKGFLAYKFPTDHVDRIYVPKLGKGKFGVPDLPNFIDYLVYAMYAFLNIPKMLKADVIIIGAPPYFDALIIPILKIFKKKIILFINDSQVETGKTYNDYNLIRKIYYFFAWQYEKIAIKMSNFVFPTSKFIYDYAIKLNKNTIHTPNGADIETISKIKAKRMFKETTVCYFGGFEMWRGIDTAIRAVQDLNKNKKNKLKLLLIGGGPDFEKIKNIAKGDENIIFTGYMNHDEAISYCKGSDILLMPSKKCLASQTVSSIKCFSYIGCGVPTIVTDSGEHAYWTRKFGTGLIVKDDENSIKDGIIRLLDNKKLYEKIKDNCKKHTDEADYKKTRELFIKTVLE